MAGRELVYQGASPVFGGARVLPSPSQFYLTGEDRLRVVSANSLASVNLKVQWRTAGFDGIVRPNSQDHTPNSDRSIKTQDYELGTGSLLNVTVFASNGTPRSGQTYVMVQIVRGFGAAAIVLGTLLAGYVTSTQALGFPGSPIQSSLEGGGYLRPLQGTTPAVGAQISETVPTGARWLIVYVFHSFTTSGTPANRFAYLEWTYGGSTFGRSAQSNVHVAGQVFSYTWTANMPIAVVSAAALIQAPLPADLVLLAGGHFNINATSIQVDDQFGAPAYGVREWLEVQ